MKGKDLSVETAKKRAEIEKRLKVVWLVRGIILSSYSVVTPSCVRLSVLFLVDAWGYYSNQ